VEADAALQKLLKKRRSEPYASQIGKNNWQRGDDHPFAAARSALDTYCNGGYRTGAVMRLIDAARDMALAISESLGEDLTSDKAEARGEALARPEFNRVTSAVSILEREGVTTKSLDKLRKIFAGAGLGQSRAWEKRQARG
jgi:hypothetical protein